MEVDTWNQIRCMQPFEDAVFNLHEKFKSMDGWKISQYKTAEILSESAVLYPEGLEGDVKTNIMILSNQSGTEGDFVVLIIQEDGEETVVSYPPCSSISPTGDSSDAPITDDLLKTALETAGET